MIRHLLCIAIVLGSQCATSVRADDDAALRPQPVNAPANKSLPPNPDQAGALAGSLRLKGNSTAIRLELRQTTITTAFVALAAAYPFKYRSAVALDELRDGTYAGSLQYVVSRLLDGYNYVIEQNKGALDIFILGKSGEQAVPPPTMAPIRQHRIPVTTRISRIRS